MKKDILIVFCVLTSCFFSCKKSTCSYYTEGINLVNGNNSADKLDTNSAVIVPAKAYVINIVLSEHVINPISNKDYSESVYYKRAYDLVEFNVHTLSNFDISHLAGSDLSNYFLTNYNANSTLVNFVENKELNDKKTLLGYKENFTSSYKIMLMNKPDFAGLYRFVVKMRFEDGNTYVDTTAINLTL